MKITIIQPFRKGKIKEIIAKNYATMEVINMAPLQLASVLEHAGNEIEFLSLQNIFRSYESKQENQLIDIINNIDTDCIIFHTDYYMSNTNTASLFSIELISNYIKKTKQDIPIILTGKIVEGLKTSIFKFVPSIDIAIKGESEDMILELLNEITKCNNLKELKTRAIICKSDDSIYENSGVGYIKDYNLLPIPNYNLLDSTISLIQKINSIKVDVLPISIRTSYGCPYHCNFCGGITNWNNYRMKNKDTLSKELTQIKEACSGKLKIVFIADEVFTLDKNHVEDVVSLFEFQNIKISGLFAHAKLFDEELALSIKRISNSVLFGAENCDNRVLELANKGIELTQVLDASKIAKSAGLNVGLEWVVGLPGETIETAADNINCMYSLLINKTVDFIEPYILCIHPNTVFYNNASELGIEINGSFDYMLEEGGYPQYFLKDSLSSNQIYIYYLFATIMINDAIRTRDLVDKSIIFRGNINLEEFITLFKLIK